MIGVMLRAETKSGKAESGYAMSPMHRISGRLALVQVREMERVSVSGGGISPENESRMSTS